MSYYRVTAYGRDGRTRGDSEDWAERWHFDGYMPADRDVWQDWLRRHGIDPHDVVVSPDGWVERRIDTYRLAYKAAVKTTFGIPTGEFIERVVQLEGPPLPFPRP